MVGVTTLWDAMGIRLKRSTRVKEISRRKEFNPVRTLAMGWERKTISAARRLRRVLTNPISGTRSRLEKKPTSETRLK